jgi:hypothetical protein
MGADTRFFGADVSKSEASSGDLVWVNPTDETIHLRVSDSTASASTRDAIKLVSKATYNDGLFVFDILRQPQVGSGRPASAAVYLADPVSPAGLRRTSSVPSRPSQNFQR